MGLCLYLPLLFLQCKYKWKACKSHASINTQYCPLSLSLSLSLPPSLSLSLSEQTTEKGGKHIPPSFFFKKLCLVNFSQLKDASGKNALSLSLSLSLSSLTHNCCCQNCSKHKWKSVIALSWEWNAFFVIWIFSCFEIQGQEKPSTAFENKAETCFSSTYLKSFFYISQKLQS